MSASIRLTPISGQGQEEAPCFLLEIDEARILLDCGWTTSFQTQLDNSHPYLEALRRVCTDLDAVLLSHGDSQHMGALPYAVANLGLQCPIYSTLPTRRMAQLHLYELHQSLSLKGMPAPFSLDEIDRTFAQFRTLKYSQDTHLQGRADGVVITPFAAGHSLGGSLWRVSKETEEVVYAQDYNHRREAHLNGTVLEAAFSHPSVLITDAQSFPQMRYVPRRKRDMELFDGLLSTLRGGGNVLVPVDSPGSRSLELLYLLNQYWAVQKPPFQLVLLSNVGYHVLEYAKSFIEWTSTQCQALFNQNRDNPFELTHVQLCYSLEELEVFAEHGPLVVLATLSDMENSFAEDLLVKWAGDSKNLVVFPAAPRKDSLADKVLKAAHGETLLFEQSVLVPLEGVELSQYLAKQRSEQIVEEEDSDSDGDERGEGVSEQPAIFKKSTRLTPSFPMFMGKEGKRVWDDYGELIRPEEFVGENLGLAVDSGERMDLDSADHDQANEEDEDDEFSDQPLVPSKPLVQTVQLQVQCSVLNIDFEGRVDWRSMKNILERVAPQKIVLVRGSADTKQELSAFCRENVCRSVHVPVNHQPLMLTSDTSTFKVKLRETLVRSLQLRPVTMGTSDVYEVAHVDGRMEAAEYGLAALGEITGDEDVKGHDAVFLGEVKLPDVRKTLSLEGIDSEFVGGILVCDDGSVNIRKVSDNALSVRGTLGQNYFYIRNVLYSHYQIV